MMGRTSVPCPSPSDRQVPKNDRSGIGDLDNDLPGEGVLPSTLQEMDKLMITVADAMDRFERWFDQRFGWFFTNGMKGRSVGR